MWACSTKSWKKWCIKFLFQSDILSDAVRDPSTSSDVRNYVIKAISHKPSDDMMVKQLPIRCYVALI